MTDALDRLGLSYIMGFIFTNIKSLKVSTVKSPPTDLDIFFTSLILTQCLVTYLRLGVFLVPDIYVETYVYDDVYVRVLMTSYFRGFDHRFR